MTENQILEEVRKIVEGHDPPEKKENVVQQAIDHKMQGIRATGRNWMTIEEAVAVLNTVRAQGFSVVSAPYTNVADAPLYKAAIRGKLDAPKNPLTKIREVNPESLADWLSSYSPRTAID